ncbi:MAG: 23S rRNA (uracil(1939)-C(5))-methyltransferase RlmD, partial [Lactimicrobium sp.]|uniref:23S rRNA (uracil(1939)-C(5))-methyltransferase RlmD n=2 Tax=Lactimicrobium sp. TaxID=2563780 RepID=UPI002F34F9C3
RMKQIRIVKTGINGEGIGYEHHKPVFVKGALIDETVQYEADHEDARYTIGHCVRVLEKSPHRIEPACSVASKCGGCALLTMDYQEQCIQKKALLTEALWKYAGIKDTAVRDMHGSEKIIGYRNQARMPLAMVQGKLMAGFYQTGSNHFVPVDHCVIQDPILEEVRSQVLVILNKYHQKAYDPSSRTGLRYLILRTLQEKTQISIITGQNKLPAEMVKEILAVPHVSSLYQSVNTARTGVDFFGTSPVLLGGDKNLKAEMNGLQLQLSPRSFFQLNTEQAEKMYAMAVSKVDPCKTLVEAYCGVGAMSLLASTKAEKVIGIESIEEAIINAGANAAANHIDNCEFICGDAAETLHQILQETSVDTLLADPPRAGMDDAMIRTILSSSIRKIVYVSCNPATLAKNLKELKKEYQILTIIPFDMFPNTPHVESITVLMRNGVSTGRRNHRKRGRHHALSEN